MVLNYYKGHRHLQKCQHRLNHVNVSRNKSFCLDDLSSESVIRQVLVMSVDSYSVCPRSPISAEGAGAVWECSSSQPEPNRLPSPLTRVAWTAARKELHAVLALFLMECFWNSTENNLICFLFTECAWWQERSKWRCWFFAGPAVWVCLSLCLALKCFWVRELKRVSVFKPL